MGLKPKSSLRAALTALSFIRAGWGICPTMTPAEFHDAIAALHLNKSAGARFLHINRRTCGSYLSGRLPVPPQTAMLLTIMLWKNISPHEIAKRSGVPFTDRSNEPPPA